LILGFTEISFIWIGAVVLAFILLVLIFKSFHKIGKDEVGLVVKNFGFKKLQGDNPIAFNGEVGYQADLLMPGIRWKFWPLYTVRNFAAVQVAGDEIGIVFSQVGESIPTGWRTAEDKGGIRLFEDVRTFLKAGGQKGIQRPVLTPGTLIYMHPVAFNVMTATGFYGLPISEGVKKTFNQYDSDAYRPIMILPAENDEKDIDEIGIITVLDGPSNDDNTLASRIGGFGDIEKIENEFVSEVELKLNEKSQKEKSLDAVDKKWMEEEKNKIAMQKIDILFFRNKNTSHKDYQDIQAFFDSGGKKGLQHDVLSYGKYNHNPFCVDLEIRKALVVRQGEVAVIRSAVGLSSKDISGEQFKHGFIVEPGHRGIWKDALRPGKYLINPRIYASDIVPTSIITLNWAEQVSQAHQLDKSLSQIHGRSREGFEFSIDMQVQIHVPDKDASYVISRVGNMANLVNEVLHPAVGNYFRDKLQGMEAVTFIQNREKIQIEATDHIKTKLLEFNVDCYGVFIQDVIPPADLVTVLKDAQLAVQRSLTLEEQRKTEIKRQDQQKAAGLADMQKELANSEVKIQINKNKADAVKAEADGTAYQISQVGKAEGEKVLFIGRAEAQALQAKNEALGGPDRVYMIEVTKNIANSKVDIVPKVMAGTQGNESSIGQAILGLLTAKMMGVDPVSTTSKVEPIKEKMEVQESKDPEITKTPEELKHEDTSQVKKLLEQ